MKYDFVASQKPSTNSSNISSQKLNRKNHDFDGTQFGYAVQYNSQHARINQCARNDDYDDDDDQRNKRPTHMD